jgi:hypothetical protein
MAKITLPKEGIPGGFSDNPFSGKVRNKYFATRMSSEIYLDRAFSRTS